jgi:hypothetical protein
MLMLALVLLLLPVPTGLDNEQPRTPNVPAGSYHLVVSREDSH